MTRKRKRTRSGRGAEIDAGPRAAAEAEPAGHFGESAGEFSKGTARPNDHRQVLAVGTPATQRASLCRQKLATSVPGPLRPAVRSAQEC
jgi:hypothetical protein